MARSQASPWKPMAAPTRRRPEGSLAPSGYCSLLVKSLTVMRPRRRPVPSTSGSFSTLCRRSSAIAPSGAMPTGAVTSGIRVMTSPTWRLMSVSNRRSRLVTMPTSRPSSSTTGRPEMWYRAQRASTSARVASVVVVTGCVTMPASDRLTRSTCWACSPTDRFRCSTPRPPWRAIAMAMRASVTVSMAADRSGTLTSIRRETREEVSTSVGSTSLSAGSRSTSS